MNSCARTMCSRDTPQEPRKSIACIYALYKNQVGVQVEVMNVQRQPDNFSCGVFAVAYATDILSGICPVNSNYDVKNLRQHLVHCLTSGSLTPFPKLSTGQRQRKKEVVDVVLI